MENIKKKNEGGEKHTPYPKNWEHIYNEWQSGEFSSAEACQILKLPKGTFYNMAKRYENQKGVVGVRHSASRKNRYKGCARVAFITGEYADLSKKYSDFIERNILPRIDYQKLHSSYHSVDMKYAKGIFNMLHQAIFKIYGSDKITVSANSIDSSSELIIIPGVVSGNGEICLALLVLDMAGLVRSVEFLTEFGCCTESIDEEMLPEERKKLKEITQRYNPYICGYAIDLPEDKFNMYKLPEKMQDLLINYRESKVRLLCEQ